MSTPATGRSSGGRGGRRGPKKTSSFANNALKNPSAFLAPTSASQVTPASNAYNKSFTKKFNSQVSHAAKNPVGMSTAYGSADGVSKATAPKKAAVNVPTAAPSTPKAAPVNIDTAKGGAGGSLGSGGASGKIKASKGIEDNVSVSKKSKGTSGYKIAAQPAPPKSNVIANNPLKVAKKKKV